MQNAQLLLEHIAYQSVMQVAYAPNMEKDNKPESPRRARRRLRLELLLKENGGASQVARDIGTPKSHLSAITTGTRGLGDELAQKLENQYEKSAGWLDLPLSDADADKKTDSAAHQEGPPSLMEALKVLAGTLDALPEVRRAEAADRLRTLTQAPDSPKVLEALHAALIAPVAAGEMPTVEQARRTGTN